MEKPPPEGPEEKARSPEAAEKELIERIRGLLRLEDMEAALALFEQLHPSYQRDLLADLPREPQQELFAGIPPEGTADILEHLDPEEAAEISEALDPESLADILDETSPDVAADVLRQLPDERSEQVLEAMEGTGDVTPLLDYPDETAGGRMTPRFSAVSEVANASQALDALRLLGEEVESATSVLVIDADRRLVGSIGVARLALARPSAMVSDLMDREVPSVRTDTDQEECARLTERYELDHLPVVDDDGRPVGVIRGEDLVDVVVEEATEDMYRMAGIGDERAFGPMPASVRRRLPWLYLNLGTAFLAALVISLFEPTIARAVVVVVFLPVVMGQGGIGGVQTVTLVVRSMTLGEIGERRGLRLLGRELVLGLAQGVLLGVVVGLVAYLWKDSWYLGLIMGAAIVGNMLVGGFTGAAVPLALRRLRVDPALASAVFVTTATDVMGVVLALGLAALLIGYL